MDITLQFNQENIYKAEHPKINQATLAADSKPIPTNGYEWFINEGKIYWTSGHRLKKEELPILISDPIFPYKEKYENTFCYLSGLFEEKEFLIYIKSIALINKFGLPPSVSVGYYLVAQNGSIQFDTEYHFSDIVFINGEIYPSFANNNKQIKLIQMDRNTINNRVISARKNAYSHFNSDPQISIF